MSARRFCVAVVLLTAVAGGGLVAATLWFAARAPFELEVREGTVWLHVLAQSAGLSLYDAQRVAFLNMNHGPLDPLLKYCLHAAVPGAAPALVTRFFAVVLPLFVGFALWRRCRNRVLTVGFTSVVMLFLYGLGSAEFLIGRSDPTAMCLLCAALGWATRDSDTTSNRPSLLRSVGIGVLCAAMALTNSRYLPLAIFPIAMIATADGMHSVSAGILRGITALASAVVVYGAVALILFHGNVHGFYQHFFGVFSRASGWGTLGRMPFQAIPDEMLDSRWLFHAGLLILLSMALWRDWQERIARWRIVLLGALAIAGWLTLAWAFSRNHGAAGLQYFAPFYLLAFAYVAGRVDLTFKPAVSLAAFALLAVGLPWWSTWEQVLELKRVDVGGRQFAARVAEITAGAQPYSEDVHLFESRYEGQVVDMGDMVAAVSRTGYFGPVFTGTVNAQFDRLNQAPPRWVLVGADTTISPALRRLIATHYTLAAESAPIILVEHLPVRLYRLRN